MITTQLFIYWSEFLVFNFPQQSNHDAISDRKVKQLAAEAEDDTRSTRISSLQFPHEKEPYGLAAAKIPHKLHT